jgi:formylglycine-generating enzyme required for sulfatase activity
MLLHVGCWFLLLASLTTGKPPDDLQKPTADHIVDLGGVKIEFVRVGKGKFWMGSPADEKGRNEQLEEQKEVTITEDFYIGKYEVTQEQWEAVMGKGTNHCYFSRTGAGKNKVKGIKSDDLKRFPVETSPGTTPRSF